MPYVLRHRSTGEIAAATLRNVYDLDYWGAEWFADAGAAENAAAGRPDWEPLHVTDSRLKILNVKLNNDPNRRLFMDDQGSISVITGSAQ
jgi:hypothetical protein